jgi:3D (Asp-Asp-Asp) domain-containing protein
MTTRPSERSILREGIILARACSSGIEAAVLPMSKSLTLTIGIAVVCLFAGCAEQQSALKRSASTSQARRVQKVRTTAYTHCERGGHRNALGTSLSGRQVMSAASDWSRFPLGTRFRIVDTREEYIIDDYGMALVGTNTIDLYKKTHLEMKRWGVRQVDIDILEWGSNEQSLKVLSPRTKHKCVRRMILGLQKKISPRVASRALN